MIEPYRIYLTDHYGLILAYLETRLANDDDAILAARAVFRSDERYCGVEVWEHFRFVHHEVR